MRKRFFLLLFVLSSVLTAAVAQTTADSLALVSADWQVTPLQKGIFCRQATFASLYGVPQEISIFEISPKNHHLDILIHNPKEETSVAARRSGAIAAINGSYFDMKKGNSVCYLRKDGVVIDTTAAGGALTTVSNGAVLIKKGRLQILPWSKEDEKTCRLKQGSLLVSGPLMLLGGEARDLSACNPGFVNTKHPRSAVALTKEGKILLIVVDGRRKGRAGGVNIPELTHLLRVLGCEDALNLDGGGSSTLWSASMPGKGIANTPSGNAERKVANSLCVYE